MYISDPGVTLFIHQYILHIIEVYHQCFTESVSLSDVGTSTSRAKIGTPNSLYLKAVKAAHTGSALTGATSELTNSNRKKTHKKHNILC